MVIIRMARGGSKKRPFYKIVATDERKPRDSGYIERLGFYNPRAKGQEVRLELKQERIDYWISQGAQLSTRVATLLKESTEEGAEKAAKKAEKKTEKKVAKAAAAKKNVEEVKEEAS